MKKRDYILALALTLTIVFAIRTSGTPCEHKSILTEIQTLKTAILGEIDTIEINKALLDKIDEQSRYIERLEMENAAQHDYIVGMGKTWDKWASENEFPKEGVNP
jgi:hypothetical protein